jgi:hemoglobin/transferrin/lactoferrin receptor protein
MTGALAWMDGKRYAAPGAVGTQHLVPPLTANLGLTYDLLQYDLQLRATGTVAKRAKPTAAGNFTPPGYGLLDLGATWNITPTAQLNLSLNNVFDKRYFDFETASRTLTPTAAVANTVPLELFTGAGRNFSLTLDVKF